MIKEREVGRPEVDEDDEKALGTERYTFYLDVATIFLHTRHIISLLVS